MFPVQQGDQGNGLLYTNKDKIYRKTYLQRSIIMIDEERQDYCGNEQELNAEGVVVVIIGGLEAYIHQIQRRK